MGVKQQRVNELIKKEETTLLSGKPAVEPTKSVETENIDQPKCTNSNVKSEETVVKVMGVMWDKSEDCFKFDLTVFSKQTLSGTLTKRKLLSVTARFYDPLGLLSPLILPFKCKFQEICQLKVEWDEALPEDLTSRWKELVEDIEGISSFTIPRCIMDRIEAEQVKCVQPHEFADASRIAYGANMYVQVTTPDGHSSHLLASKTGVVWAAVREVLRQKNIISRNQCVKSLIVMICPYPLRRTHSYKLGSSTGKKLLAVIIPCKPWTVKPVDIMPSCF